MVQRIEVDVGKELAGQVTQGQAAYALEGSEQIVARIVMFDRLLRIRAVDDQIAERQRGQAAQSAPQVGFENQMVDGREIAPDVAT